MRLMRFFIVLLAALLLAACATRPPLPQNAEHAVSGRLAARYLDHESGKKGELYGSFDWIEQDGTTDLTLIDPLGQAVARIVWTANRTTITLRDGASYSGRTPEDLTRRTLGWELPLRGMKQWLRASAGSGAEVERNAQGRIVSLRQDGWTVRYDNAATDPPGKPSRIDLAYAGPGAEVSLRLALDP